MTTASESGKPVSENPTYLCLAIGIPIISKAIDIRGGRGKILKNRERK
jgi:hypothetical protein